MPKARLVCITGVDGAGKTTLCKNLIRELERRGYRAEYAYGRYRPVLYRTMFDFIKYQLSPYGSDEPYMGPEYERKRENLLSTLGFRYMYEAILLSEYLPQIYFRVLPKLYFADYVILDRYLLDTVLKNLRNRSSDTASDLRILKRFQSLFPSADESFFVDVSAETAFARKDDVQEIEHIETFQDRYRVLAEELDMTKINGEKPQPEMVDDVINQLLN